MINIIYLLLYFSCYMGFTISIWYTYYSIIFAYPIIPLSIIYVKLNNYMINSNDPVLSTFGIILFSLESFLIYMLHKMKIYCSNNPDSLINVIYDVLSNIVNKIQFVTNIIKKYLNHLINIIKKYLNNLTDILCSKLYDIMIDLNLKNDKNNIVINNILNQIMTYKRNQLSNINCFDKTITNISLICTKSNKTINVTNNITINETNNETNNETINETNNEKVKRNRHNSIDSDEFQLI